MIDLNSVNWAAMPDSEMAALQIETREVRTGTAISDDTVLLPKDANGIVNVDQLGPWLESVAFGELPQASSADRLTAAISVLADATDADTLNRAQAVVSDILLRYPAILDPSYFVPCSQSSRMSFATVTTALSVTPKGALPSSASTHEEALLKRFAGHRSVRRAFSGTSPSRVAIRGRHYTAQKVQESGSFMSRLRSASLSPHFVAAVLDLESVSGKRIFGTGNFIDTRLQLIEQSVVRSLGLHYLRGGEIKQREGDDVLIDALAKFKVGERFRVEPLCAFLSRSAVIEVFPSVSPTLVSVSDVEHNCRLVMEALVKLGLAADRHGAAKIMYAHVLGGNQPMETHDSGAFGFMQAMDEAGFELSSQLKPPANMASAPVRANYARWANAQHVVMAKQAMKRVLESDSGVPTSAPTPRRARAVQRAI